MIKHIQTRLIGFLLLALCSVPCAADELMPSDADAQASLQTLSTGSDDDPANWSDRAREVLVNALSLTGVKYKYGGNSPESGFDCSGFVRYVFNQAASLTLPHSALALSQMGKSIPKGELKPGDLVFFKTIRNAVSHVGIYLGNNRFIHSPRTGANVRVESLKTSYWATRFSGAQRIDVEDAENTAPEQAPQ